MQVDGRVHADLKAVTLSWPEDDTVFEYIYDIDGNTHLIDGKRHFTFDGTTHSVPIGIPQDGKAHTFGVTALKPSDNGNFSYDPNAAPTPPPIIVPPLTRKNLWTADFENGFGHFSPQDTDHGGKDSCGTDAHCEIVPASAGMPGTKMLRCRVMGASVRPPNPQNKHTTRAQGNLDPNFFKVVEGDEVWLEWLTCIPSDPSLNDGPFTSTCILWQFGAGNGPQIVLQDQNDGKGPMFELAAAFTNPPRKHFRFAPLLKGHEFKLNLHLKISVDPAKGLVELDYDDVKVIAPTACQTLYGGGQDFNYDMYRTDNSAQNGGKGYNTTVDFSGVTSYTP